MDPPVEYGAAGKGGAVAACANDGGAYGFRTKTIFPGTKQAFPDGLPQFRANIPEFVRRKRIFDAVRHTPGKRDDAFFFRRQPEPRGFPGVEAVKALPYGTESGCHFQSFHHFPDGLVVLPSAHIEAAGACDLPFFDQGKIAGATSNVHVQHGLSGFF